MHSHGMAHTGLRLYKFIARLGQSQSSKGKKSIWKLENTLLAVKTLITFLFAATPPTNTKYYSSM